MIISVYRDRRRFITDRPDNRNKIVTDTVLSNSHERCLSFYAVIEGYEAVIDEYLLRRRQANHLQSGTQDFSDTVMVDYLYGVFGIRRELKTKVVTVTFDCGE